MKKDKEIGNKNKKAVEKQKVKLVKGKEGEIEMKENIKRFVLYLELYYSFTPFNLLKWVRPYLMHTLCNKVISYYGINI